MSVIYDSILNKVRMSDNASGSLSANSFVITKVGNTLLEEEGNYRITIRNNNLVSQYYHNGAWGTADETIIQTPTL